MVISSSKHLKMTIKQREPIQNFLQHKKVLIFDGKNENLGEAEMAKSHHVSDGKQNLWKTLRHAAAHQHYVDKQSTQFIEQSGQEINMEDKGICLSEDRQIDEEGVNDGGNDHLLILAQSAELVMESEDRFDGLGRIVQNNQGLHVAPMAQHSFGNFSDAIVTGQCYETIHFPHCLPLFLCLACQKSGGKQIDAMPVICHVPNEENGARSPRLSQIRRQARSKCDLSEQGSIGDCAAGHLQGGRTRLTQIRHQARFKNQLQMQDRTEKPCMNSQERIIRLSQLRRLARSKSNSVVKQAIPDHMHGHSDYQPSKDNQKGRIIAAIFGEEDSIQVG